MASTAQGDWRPAFQQASEELNYGRRCTALSAIGRRLAEEGRSKVLTEDLAGKALDTHEALSLLTVAQRAGCAEAAKGLLVHPSQVVRLRAVRLLRREDAEEAFLSADSNQQVKTWLMRSCPALPCSQPVLEHAQRMFSPEQVWAVLQRTRDEAVFSEWADRLEALWPSKGLPGLARLAGAFPDTVLRLVSSGKLSAGSWDWLLPLAQRRPKALLAALLQKDAKCRLDQETRGKFLQWAWRHQHEAMLELCREMSDGKGKWALPLLDVLRLQQQVLSSHACPTAARKIETVVAVFCGLPESQRTVQEAKRYMELMPMGIKEHRAVELERLVAAYWRIVGDLGRGQLEQAANGGLFEALAMRLPPPLAVEQFFRVCQDVDPQDSVYKLLQSKILPAEDGRHDALMQKVFERYLQSRLEGRGVADCVKMFQALLKDAVSMDVVQRSFEAFTAQRLRGATERSLFREVVARMKDLDAEVTADKEGKRGKAAPRPPPLLPLPAAWLRFVPHPDGAPPHVAYLHGALAAWQADATKLAEATQRFGTALFWSALEEVLLHAMAGKAGAGPQWPKEKASFAAFEDVKPAPPRVQAAAAAPGEQAAVATTGYFAGLEAKKQETFHRDANTRLEGYERLLYAVRREPEAAPALEDFVKFLATRFGGEQENVQFQVIGGLLNSFSAEVWREVLTPLKALWAIFSKARGPQRTATSPSPSFLAAEAWEKLGRRLLHHELAQWQPGQSEASEACIFSVELSRGRLQWHKPFEEVHKEKGVREEAARWLLHAAVPLPQAPPGALAANADSCPLEEFLNAAGKMGDVLGLSQPELWKKWPWLLERWEALLGCGLSLRSTEFLLAGAVSHVLERQEPPNNKGQRKVWRVPLEAEAYRQAVRRVLRQIEEGEVPCLEGAQMLAKRCRATEELAKGESVPAPWFEEVVRGGPWNAPAAKIERGFPEKGLEEELATLGKLLATDGCTRGVHWAALQAVAGLKGEASDRLLEHVIKALDARKEGMARCVVQNYPYVNAALAPAEKPQGNSDLLTAALEMWLHNVKTRDARVCELMAREDAECLLFFGHYFAEHLSRCRQEHLHLCLSRLSAPPEEGEPAEFYHHGSRVLPLARVAQYSKGWRCLQRPHDPSRMDTHGSILTFFWHPKTQAEFLAKALNGTDMSILAIIPALEYVDGVGRAGELLALHPREQAGKLPEEPWTVLQPSGTFQAVWDEVQRRFAELPAPVAKSAIGDREADQLLVNLGRADHADNALKILGRYASKFKRAKEALVLAVPNLSPSHARRVIQEVCFSKEAGVSLQVAALRLVGDLQVPAPLELYRTAWREGACHRDIAAQILVKVATAPVPDWGPEEVRDMFTILDRSAGSKAAKVEEGLPVPAGKKYPEGTYQAMSAAREENVAYMANILLSALYSVREWTLPFLPQVVGRLALLPEAINAAVAALRANQGQVTEMVGVLTELLRQARLAELTLQESGGQKKRKPGQEPLSKLLHQLSLLAPGNSMSISRHVATMRLGECDAAVLRALVAELFLSYDSSTEGQQALVDAVEIWVHALKRGGGGWAEILEEMEGEVVAFCGPKKLNVLLGAVWRHVASLQLERTKDGPWLFPVLRGSLERVMGRLNDEVAGGAEAAEHILWEYWSILVSQGCGKEDVAAFLAYCPKDKEVSLASSVVNGTRKASWWRAVGKEEAVADEAAADEAAQRVLAWLATATAAPPLPALASLWPQVLRGADASLEAPLALFGKKPQSRVCVTFVEQLVQQQENLALQLRALRWLGKSLPREAAQLFPLLLKSGKAVAVVEEMLKFCEEKHLEPPDVPKEALASREVLALLAKSPLARARVAAVRGLRERDLKGKNAGLAPVLKELSQDSCAVVSVAARLAWASIFGEEPERA